MKHPFYLHDSKVRAKVPFEPEFAGQARIYLCGPTVYDEAHLGHARSAISFDLLRRTLSALGYAVQFARNVTDVDDKIIKKMADTGQTLPKLTGFYAGRYHADMAALNVLPPDIEPKATGHIAPMIALVQNLLERGCAYRADNGDIYFDTAKDAAYGSTSGETQDEVLSRVAGDQKKNARDFVLWKAAKTDESVVFESPFGLGRPGWHLECSAMVQSHLWREGAKYACDIHAGGADLFFPHHENEAAQTRCGYGIEIARYWMHNGFVRIDGEKMSKSLGNSFFIKDALLHFPGEALRFYLMSIHYRAGLNYNDQDLHAAKKRLDRLYRLKKRLDAAAGEAEAGFKNDLLEAMADDLNISKALAAVDEMVGHINDALDKNPKDKALKAAAAGNLALIQNVLGVGFADPYEWFQWGVDGAEKARIESLIAARAEAKAAKDYVRADEIRGELMAMGVALMDIPGRTVWEKSL